MLSGPLPGTRARDDEDAARAVENAVRGFDGVERAHAIITSDPAGSSASARLAAIQLALDGDPPAAAWIENVAGFILQALPGVAPTDLTIVDTAGNALYLRGTVVESASMTAAGDPAIPPRVAEQRIGWGAAALVGATLVSGLLLLRRRNDAEEPLADHPSGPFAFIADLSDEDLRLMFEDERPAVVAAVMQLAPFDERERLRLCSDAQALPALERPPSSELVTALENSLRMKLVSR